MSELRTQSKLASLVEAFANTAIGFIVAYVANWWFFKLLGIKATHSQFLLNTFLMTALSVVRGYCLRRMWNAEWWKRFKRRHASANLEAASD